ncbi:hypothetical protein AVEN_206190-1 [Araneus ventricosus]|uniref:Uncharacterized protein n=1 Tax=Araneus ventricosus TaxID=182803 RepID=A0A4Y2AJC4_ARAVE|nr:hypothetical protein AVEN_206190-1 [Araneus ventricosus]
MTSSQQACFASGLFEYALFLFRKFAAKLPHQVCHDKLISRKIKLAVSAIWVPYFINHHYFGSSGRLENVTTNRDTKVGGRYKKVEDSCFNTFNATDALVCTDLLSIWMTPSLL